MIEIDYRERNSSTARVLSQAGLSVRYSYLKVGDYRVENALVIERKSSWDFLQSLFDGRLFRQISSLARSAPRALLIVEGLFSRLDMPTVRGTLVSIAAVFGVPVLFSKDGPDSAQWILGAERQFEARREDALRRPGWRPRGKRARQLFVLQGLPGIGPRKASALLSRFGTVKGVLCASFQELLGVEGIGPKTAQRILWLAN